jgi:hypothetical protein
MGRWEQPQQNLPPFRLHDLNGKVWNSEKLLGKTVVMGLWATWSGPSVLQLAKWRSFLDLVKDRDDIQPLSLNVDEDLNKARAMAERESCDFPILAASVYAHQAVRMLSVPRVWIVDAKGSWRWEIVGFDATLEDWENELLKKVEQTQEAAAG